MKIKWSRLYLGIDRAAQSGDKQELLEWGLIKGDHVRSEWQTIAQHWNSAPQSDFIHFLRCIISKLRIDIHWSISSQYIKHATQLFDITYSRGISYVKYLAEILLYSSNILL